MTFFRIDLARSSVFAGLVTAALVASVAPAVAGTSTSGAHATTTQYAVQRRADSGPNPLAGHAWGVYKDPRDSMYQAFQASSGSTRSLLGKVIMQPRVRWFGATNKYSTLYKSMRRYIEYSQNGNRGAIVQMAVFRMDPWEAAACSSAPGPAAQASYKRWIDRFATAVGLTHAAIILQPDLPLALKCSSRIAKAALNLVAYAAKRFSTLRNATTYLDAGAADWETASNAAWLLRNAGVSYTRGFALNASHSDSTTHQLEFGNKVRKALAARGYPGTHFVINTASNGKPFVHTLYHAHNNHSAPACQTRTQTRCVTLGIPPTANTASTAWHLGSTARAIAAKHCDGYLWIGRPWMQNSAFDRARTLLIARTTPW